MGGFMSDSSEILNVIESLKESDKYGAIFQPVIEKKHLTWKFKIYDFDKLGILLSHLEIHSSQAVSLKAEAQGDELSRKVTYLEESFRLVEQDAQQQTLILRSHWPFQGEERVGYFEIVLKANRQLTFTRYEWDKATGRRQEIPVNLAKSTFVRLLNDLEALFQPSQGDTDS